jgi:hypothetical protein
LFDQWYVFPATAVSKTDPPVQKVVGPDTVTALEGSAFTVTTVFVEVEEHPALFVIFTL